MPYQRYARFASIALVLIVIISFAFPDTFSNLMKQAGTGLAILTLLAALLTIGLMIRDVSRQQLFIIRNATFYVGSLTLAVMIWFVYQDYAGNTDFQFPAWWLLALLLFYHTEQLSRVRMDNMLLEVKMGAGQLVSVPLFDLTSVIVEETSVEATRTNGEQFLFKRSYFSSGQWEILKQRFEQLAAG